MQPHGCLYEREIISASRRTACG